MGSLVKVPKPPSESEESKRAKAAERERLAREQAEIDFQNSERDRKRRNNLIGSESLQDESLQGYGGFRKSKKMGMYDL